jgi:alpha-L-rhamnosidase
VVKKVLLRPEPLDDLTSASGHYDSIHGRIESRWRIEDGHFRWWITVPSNTTAEVHVPATSPNQVTESDRPLDQAQGIAFLRMEPAREMKKSVGRAIFKVGSGEYEFHSRLRINLRIAGSWITGNRCEKLPALRIDSLT